MSLLSKIFTKKENKPQPKAGETWVRDYKDDCPFDRGHLILKIKDVKNGWVNYQHGDGKLFNNEVMKLSLFTSLYKRKINV